MRRDHFIGSSREGTDQIFIIQLPNARVLAWVFVVLIGGIHLINAFRLFMLTMWGRGSLMGFLPLFDVDREANIPTFYSALTLLIAAGMAGYVAALERRSSGVYWKHWVGISLVFACLALDESCQVHELVMGLMGFARSGVFFFAWIIPAIVMVTALTIFYFKMIFSLPKWFRRRAILSAFVFMSGALGMEAFAGPIYQAAGPSIGFQISCAVEELLEMAGVAIWICALRSYIGSKGESATLSLGFLNEVKSSETGRIDAPLHKI